MNPWMGGGNGSTYTWEQMIARLFVDYGWRNIQSKIGVLFGLVGLMLAFALMLGIIGKFFAVWGVFIGRWGKAVNEYRHNID